MHNSLFQTSFYTEFELPSIRIPVHLLKDFEILIDYSDLF
jgi:hypothetical protein